MSYSYPIWHAVQACHYKSDKSWGGKDNSLDKIYVGSSVKNSELMAKINTIRRFFDDEELGSVCVFKLYVDDIKIREMWFKNNKGRAGEFIKRVDFMKE